MDAESLVEIPIQWALDDWEQYCFVPDFSGSGLIESPAKVAEMRQSEFDGLREAGGCFVLTNHPFLSGRPSRAAALEGLIEHACSRDDVWVSHLGAYPPSTCAGCRVDAAVGATAGPRRLLASQVSFVQMGGFALRE